MKCLCCGKEIDNTATDELRTKWHRRCVRSFFGTESLPTLDIKRDQLTKLVEVNIEEGLTIPGVQKKMSLHLDSNGSTARLTLIDYPTGYILKPQADEYAHLPEYEWLGMHLAESLGVKVVPFALYDTSEELVYLTKRIDRNFTSDIAQCFAMEDFCQLSERLAEDKYKGSYESCVRIIRKYSKTPGIDIAELFLRIIVSYILGNSDLHLKNLSLIEAAPGERDFALSKAYDILPVKAVEPRDLDELALSLNAKKRDLTRQDFLDFAEYCKLGSSVAIKMITKLNEKMPEITAAIQNSFLSSTERRLLTKLIDSRLSNLIAI